MSDLDPDSVDGQERGSQEILLADLVEQLLILYARAALHAVHQRVRLLLRIREVCKDAQQYLCLGKLPLPLDVRLLRTQDTDGQTRTCERAGGMRDRYSCSL